MPELDDPLRQGDLLANLPFPRRGTLELTVDEMRAAVYPSRYAVVLDRCCTIDQKWTVLVARVGTVKMPPVGHKLREAFEAGAHFQEGKPYSKYFHPILSKQPELADPGPAKVLGVELLERVSVATKSATELDWLNAKRIGRMKTVDRAHLRSRLMIHFSQAEADDQAELAAQGFDVLGQPQR